MTFRGAEILHNQGHKNPKKELKKPQKKPKVLFTLGFFWGFFSLFLKATQARANLGTFLVFRLFSLSNAVP